MENAVFIYAIAGIVGIGALAIAIGIATETKKKLKLMEEQNELLRKLLDKK